MIVLELQVAVVNILEKSPNLDRRTVGMEKGGAVLIGRIDCMRNAGGGESQNGRF